MKITALVENISHNDLRSKHGLSLYIETNNHKVLFDLGPDQTLFDNCLKRGININEIDIVIISHGHSDHGGALKQFLQMNHHAKVYIQRSAFDNHYCKISFIKVNVGLDKQFKNHPQVILVDGDYHIDNELELFVVTTKDRLYSIANKPLYTENNKDDFKHEQNLIIHGKDNYLIMGCGHKGVINILENAKRFNPSICIGGYHLYNPITKRTALLDPIIENLRQYNIEFYTCHCTGKKAYDYLSQHLNNMHYLSCGETIEL
ncbi:MAG: MBL fold metallo-hydrolase [Coprobacillus sp.]